MLGLWMGILGWNKMALWTQEDRNTMKVKDAERAFKEAGKAYEEARDKVQAVLETAEADALRKYNEDTAPFLKTYQIATSTAFRKAQDESIKLGDTLGAREIEAYKELLQARKDLREATKVLGDGSNIN